MAQTEWPPLVEVSAALIRSGDRILVVYNPVWGSFTLPMSKRRHWFNNPQSQPEDWADAAARAAAECLGRTVFPELLLEQAVMQQGNREGAFAEYRFQVFHVAAQDEALTPGVVGQWLTAEEIRDPNRRPISPTAIALIEEMKTRGLV